VKHIKNFRKFRLRGLQRCERGATAVEYAMIIVMIALAVVGSMTLAATKTINMWSNVSTAVNNS